MECSAPLCYENCVHYAKRSDGRCKRFENGFFTFEDEKACCGQGAHIKFRKWANMMTVVFPSMMYEKEYTALFQSNQKLGKRLKKIADSRLPVKVRWESIRTAEFLRRRKLRRLTGGQGVPDAFLFHGFSYGEESFRLIIEIYDEHTPLFKTALNINHGENLFVLDKEKLSPECWKANNLVKIYPENDIEAEMDILWCDFVTGYPAAVEIPSEKVKCVVWDLDNTIWDGTLIETDNISDLHLNAYVLETIQNLDKRGIVQSIASKNDHDAAWQVIQALNLDEYFLYPQIHWNAKSGSIEQIARDLNIGIDSFAFIDDSVFEREQVHSVLPQVRIFDAAEIQGLLEKPEFSVMITQESQNRRKMYQAEEKRNELKTGMNEDTADFLKKCHLRIELFEPKSDDEIMRCYELVVRTNQLNMSGEKYTKDEFEQILNKPNHSNFAFSCKDDFGEYGIVGFGQYQIEDNTLIFTEFAMSCRVAGKYVESALFTSLLKREHCKQGHFEVKKTKKNALLRRTLDEIGFVQSVSDANHVVYSFSAPLKHDDLVLYK